MDIFSLLLPKYKIDKDKKIRLISLFSGYDSQKLAFNYIGVDVEHYRAIEFDKYAIQSLNEIHNTNFETKDITKVSADELGIVDTENITYLLTYSFPCQSLSLAGKREGMDIESGTRSGLLWEVERLLKETKEKPQILIMENVPQVLSAKGWREWNVFLENLGYSNYAQVLNAKNFGIPQNRERCFMVSILGEYSYEFPKPFELKDRLKDFLENNVDEKYYLSEKMKSYIFSKNDKYKVNDNNVQINRDTACAITTREGSSRDDTSNYVSDEKKSKAELLLLLLYNSGELKDKDFPCGCDSSINEPKVREISNCITSRYDAGIQNQKQIGMCVVENQNMKTTLCNALIENGVVKENYVINHSYTNGLTGKNPNSRQTLDDYIETTDNSSPCLTTRPDTLEVVVKETEPKLVGGFGEKKSNGGTQWYQQDRVYDSENVAMCHCENIPNGSYNYQVKEKRKSCYNCKHFYYDTFCGFNNPMCSKYGSLYNKESICDNCLDYEETQNIEYQDLTNLRIRKLTPYECFKLMGVKPTDSNKITCSNAQKYKQAGNSIVTTVLMAIYSQLFENCDYKYYIEELLKELRTN